MRILVLAALLLASTSLSPVFAEEPGKGQLAAPQMAPAPPDISPQPRDQRSENDRPRGDGRDVNRDGRMRRGDGGMMGRDREMSPERRMHRDREDYRDGDKDVGRYGRWDDNRASPGSDRADRPRAYADEDEEDQPRRRLKVCIEYDNGDEYCHYKRR